MTIVIPMSGLSSRFKREGYVIPKYMLYAGNRSLFNLSVSSFKEYFEKASFLFIARDTFCTEQFIRMECDLMGVKKYEIVILNELTRGQAETVYLGLLISKALLEEEILIFNIDTFREGFKMPELYSQCDGFLEVFKGKGSNWSYAKTEGETSTKVIETAEKREISSYCSDGIYYFKTVELFNKAFENMKAGLTRNISTELYVAPLYNYLIGQGYDIRISLIERNQVEFCGVPSEYFDYLSRRVVIMLQKS